MTWGATCWKSCDGPPPHNRHYTHSSSVLCNPGGEGDGCRGFITGLRRSSATFCLNLICPGIYAIAFPPNIHIWDRKKTLMHGEESNQARPGYHSGKCTGLSFFLGNALVFKVCWWQEDRKKESKCKIMGSCVTRDNDKRELLSLFWHKVCAAASGKVSM